MRLKLTVALRCERSFSQQKKDMLQAAVLMQSEEGCTFAPVITNKSKRMPKQDTRPVHILCARFHAELSIN